MDGSGAVCTVTTSSPALPGGRAPGLQRPGLTAQWNQSESSLDKDNFIQSLIDPNSVCYTVSSSQQPVVRHRQGNLRRNETDNKKRPSGAPTRELSGAAFTRTTNKMLKM